MFGIVKKIDREEWGKATSLRVLYSGLPEIEFVMASREWASVTPVDEGTAGVVKKGAKILYDPQGILSQLIKNVNS